MFHKLLNKIKEQRKKLLMGIDLEGLVTYPSVLVDEPDNLTMSEPTSIANPEHQ